MSNFECSKCGSFTPIEIYDSAPAQASCPKCGEMTYDKNGGIKIMSEEESRAKRPELYDKVFPIRQDITVLPADKGKKMKLGWKIYEYRGCEVFKPFKGWVDKFNKSLDKDGNYGHLLEKYAIHKLEGLKEGDTVIVGTLVGLDEATVTSIDYDKKEAMARNEFNWYPLEFGGDDRNAWVVTMGFNNCCLEELNVCRGEEEIQDQ